MKRYHNADNRVKAIHTKSGHKLIFTEDESILLTDKNGNVKPVLTFFEGLGDKP